MKSPEEAAEEARLQAEAERLRGELEQITEKVQQIAGQTRNALIEMIQQNQERKAYLQGQLDELQPLDQELESAPPSPYKDVMREKLEASKALCEAGITLVDLQLQEMHTNLEATQGEIDPETVKLVDIGNAPEYLLAKAESDVAAVRLKLADFRMPMSILDWYFDPQREENDNELILKVKEALDQDKTLKIEMNVALSNFKEALGLIEEGKKVIRGIRQFDWSLALIHEFGDKVWGKLKGHVVQMERIADKVADTPLSAIFLKKPDPEPLPYERELSYVPAAPPATASGTGRLSQTGNLSGTGRLNQAGTPGTGRLLNQQG